MNEGKTLFKFSSSYIVEGVIAANSRDEAYEYLLTSTPEELKAKIAAQGKYVEESYNEEILYEIKDKSTLVDIDLTQRQVPLEAAIIKCLDGAELSDNGLLEFCWELQADSARKYFGADTETNLPKHICFRTYLHGDGNITAEYFLREYHPKGCEWSLTLEEKQFLSHKMQDYCIANYGENMLSRLERLQNEYSERE